MDFPNFKKFKMLSYFLRCLRPCKLLLGLTLYLIHAVNTNASSEDFEFHNCERMPISHPKFVRMVAISNHLVLKIREIQGKSAVKSENSTHNPHQMKQNNFLRPFYLGLFCHKIDRAQF